MKSWIYEIIQKDSNLCIYIGSSTGKYFCLRKCAHTRPSQLKSGKQSKLYNYIEENNGWESFKFNIIKEYDIIEKSLLLINEKKYIQEKIPLCNSNLPILSDEECKEKNKLKARKFRSDNPDYWKKYEKSEYRINAEKKRCNTKIICECGGTYTLQNKTNHYARNIHKNYIII